MVQARDAVLHGIARGQHQNRHALAGFAQFAANCETIRRGNHHIEDHQVVGVYRRLIKCIFACRRYIDGVRLFAQSFSHEPRYPRIIFHQQKPHESIIRQIPGK